MMKYRQLLLLLKQDLPKFENPRLNVPLDCSQSPGVAKATGTVTIKANEIKLIELLKQLS